MWHLQNDDLDNMEATGVMDGAVAEEEEVVDWMILHHHIMGKIPMGTNQPRDGDLASGVERRLERRRHTLLERREEIELKRERFHEPVVVGLVVEEELPGPEVVTGETPLRGVTVGVRALDMRVLALALQPGDE